MIFATVSVALMLSSISATSIAVAFPIITAYFGVPLTIAGWIISVYQLGFTVTMPIIGKVSDVLSRKSTFILCLVLFVSASTACAFVDNVGLLIFFRLIQAFGGGGFMPSAVGIISEEFPETRQKMIGLFSSILPIGQIIGPNVGGWLVDSFGWRSVFMINLPLGAVVLLMAVVLLKADERKEGSIDFLGAGLVGGVVAFLMLGLTFLGYDSLKGWSWALFLVSAISAAFLIRHENRAEDPILDIEILKRKPFVAANLYNLIYGGAVIGVLSPIPAFAASVYKMSASECGLLLPPKADRDDSCIGYNERLHHEMGISLAPGVGKRGYRGKPVFLEQRAGEHRLSLWDHAFYRHERGCHIAYSQQRLHRASSAKGSYHYGHKRNVSPNRRSRKRHLSHAHCPNRRRPFSGLRHRFHRNCNILHRGRAFDLHDAKQTRYIRRTGQMLLFRAGNEPQPTYSIIF
ncbi:MFS transporter [Acetomicrobium sp.]|uniref:MFS transporter n=1 Tax=Acetomicrobium sp. TaxID=1872099 RepID=UPI002870EF44|nr:MFS transporter [Acetomicrobium sp.]MDR9768976.1 MFS transporter [Acetomicrobium sp.]